MSHGIRHMEMRHDSQAESMEWREESLSGKLKRGFEVGGEWKGGRREQ